ncbi:probable aquaporin TIP3-1 [Telopea speciosissima]|uniref:probable aquaporin TIP3-1 n=1 Tax=Telopea speciosissima TaxID=54955 RepID=UPI001CC50F9C|nr:probable aquaporin TIP3-1 [Telopea speciosissima]
MDVDVVVVKDEESLQISHLVDNRIQSASSPLSLEDPKVPSTTSSRKFYLFMRSRLGSEELTSFNKRFMRTFGKRLGLEEFTSLKTWRATFAELLGMATACFAMDVMVVGTLETEKESPRLLMSILAAVIITIMLLTTFPISGGHLNPAVSFCAALMGLISVSRAVIYIVAQCAGAVFGALAFKAVVSNQIGEKYALGGCRLGVIVQGPEGPTTVGIGTSQGLWLEILSMFFVLFPAGSIRFIGGPALGCGPVFSFSIVGIMAGLAIYVTVAVTQVKGYSGAGLNPARCFGPAIVRGGHMWDRHWVFWVGPAIASVAFYLYTKIIPSEHFYANCISLCPQSRV